MSKKKEGQVAEIENARIDSLVTRAQNGEMDAFDDLIRTFQTQIFNLAYRMVHNREDAADLTQEIFVKLYRSISAFSGRSKFSTWLYSVAANTCRSGIRRLSRISRREVLRLDEIQETETGTRQYELADPADLPDTCVERNETQKTIETMIAELPENERMMIVLRELQDLSYEEIARITGRSIGTVKSRISRARMKLRDTLTREGLTCTANR